VVNRYKTEAPLWKKEILENGREYWINNSDKSKKN
jgi:molybdopterin synthase catalytic subunit